MANRRTDSNRGAFKMRNEEVIMIFCARLYCRSKKKTTKYARGNEKREL